MKLHPVKTAAFLALCFLLGLVLTGCITSPEGKTVPDIARIALVTREAATIGTSQALMRNPQWKDKFILVVAQLRVLEAQPDITVESLLGIIGQLPVNELRSDNATLAISSARLLVVAAGWSSVPIVRAEQLRPVVTALREGLEAGGAVSPQSFIPRLEDGSPAGFATADINPGNEGKLGYTFTAEVRPEHIGVIGAASLTTLLGHLTAEQAIAAGLK